MLLYRPETLSREGSCTDLTALDEAAAVFFDSVLCTVNMAIIASISMKPFGEIVKGPLRDNLRALPVEAKKENSLKAWEMLADFAVLQSDSQDSSPAPSLLTNPKFGVGSSIPRLRCS